ncbi:hypothetical protein [Sphingopyxis sp. 550A]
MNVRINHGRIKPRYNPKPNAAERRHKDRVKRMPCCGCGRRGPSDAHHTLLPVPGKRWRRDHEFIVPVCKDCHQGTNGIHGIGHEGLWCDRVGVDTAAIATRLRAESIEIGILPKGSC